MPSFHMSSGPSNPLRSILPRPVYASNSGSWFYYVTNLSHDDWQTLFDHIPTIATIQLVQVQFEGTLRKGSYLKMDAYFLDDEQFKNQIQAK